MAATQTDDPKLPPDKGKEWMETSLPRTDDEDSFEGFSEQELQTQNETQQRKRRENTTHQDKQNKLLKTSQSQSQSQHNTRSQTQKQVTKNTNHDQQPNTNKNSTTEKVPFTNSSKQTNKKDQIMWIQNNQHNVLFIEPISIKEGEKLLEPMEVGKFLYDIGLNQFTELKRAGQYRYKLIYKNPKDAEKILNSTQTLKNNNYKAFIPRMLLETTGIIKNVPISLTEKDIYHNTISAKKITRIERIKKRSEPKDPNSKLVDTRSIKITFEGPELPETVCIYGVHEKPEIYIYPVKICTKCWRLGHKEIACKSKKNMY